MTEWVRFNLQIGKPLMDRIRAAAACVKAPEFARHALKEACERAETRAAGEGGVRHTFLKAIENA